jgi:glutamyl-tRNA reductase
VLQFLVHGLSYKTAPVAVREACAVPRDAVSGVLQELTTSSAIDEALILSTCNRVEVYVVHSGTVEAAVEAINSVLFVGRGLEAQTVEQHGYTVSGRDAVHHLLRVATSLDSMVVGEPQILGQVKEAAALAREAGVVGPLLGRVLERTFGAAKAVRTDTGISRDVVSIGSVAVDLARRIFDDLAECRVLIIGAGKMAETTARSLTSAGVTRVYVANRSHDRASALAARHGWRARSLDELSDLLGQVDVVIASTGAPRPIITSTMVRQAVKVRKYRPLFIVDIAVPRDVEEAVGELDTLYLYNVDDLEGISQSNMAGRQREVTAAEQMVRVELELLEGWFRSLAVKPTVTAIRARATELALGELERTWAKRLSHLGDEERASMEKMVEAMVSKLLHPTMSALRDAASRGDGLTLVAAARTLHGVEDVDAEGEDA